MSCRFGKFDWEDADRLNLLKTYLEHPNWSERTKAMQEFYATLTNAKFTEKICADEFERILKEPTPNLRKENPSTFVYNRNIQIENWIQYFESRVEKKREEILKNSLTSIHKNTSEVLEILKENDGERMNERVRSIHSNLQERKPEDKKTFASLYAAITERIENGGLEEIINSLKKSPSADSSASPTILPLNSSSTAPLPSAFFSTPSSLPMHASNLDATKDVAPTTSARPSKGKKHRVTKEKGSEKKARNNSRK